MQKSCIVETTGAAALILKRHLPPDVLVVAEQPFAGSPIIELRLAGDGLPAWCRIGSDSPEIAMRAVAEVLEDGSMRFIPGSGLPLQQILEGINE